MPLASVPVAICVGPVDLPVCVPVLFRVSFPVMANSRMWFPQSLSLGWQPGRYYFMRPQLCSAAPASFGPLGVASSLPQSLIRSCLTKQQPTTLWRKLSSCDHWLGMGRDRSETHSRGGCSAAICHQRRPPPTHTPDPFVATEFLLDLSGSVVPSWGRRGDCRTSL